MNSEIQKIKEEAFATAVAELKEEFKNDPIFLKKLLEVNEKAKTNPNAILQKNSV